MLQIVHSQYNHVAKPYFFKLYNDSFINFNICGGSVPGLSYTILISFHFWDFVNQKSSKKLSVGSQHTIDLKVKPDLYCLMVKLNQVLIQQKFKWAELELE